MATISPSGQLSMLVTGSTGVTAAAGSVSASTTVTVRAAKLVSIAITPLNPTIAVGATAVAGSGTYTDGRTVDLTTKGAWKSSNHTVALVGLHTGVATAKTTIGSTTITFQAGSFSVATTLNVGPGGAA